MIPCSRFPQVLLGPPGARSAHTSFLPPRGTDPSACAWFHASLFFQEFLPSTIVPAPRLVPNQ